MHRGTQGTLEIAAREALASRSRPASWPESLRTRFVSESARSQHAEARFLLKIGMVVVIVSPLIEAVTMPDHFVELLLLRLALVLPLQVAAFACPVERLGWQKSLMSLSLLLFGAILLHASMWAPWPVNAYMASGPISLFAVALPVLPFDRRGQIAFAGLAFGTVIAMVLLGAVELPGAQIYIAVAGLIGAFSLIIASRFRRLAERAFLLGIVAEERLANLEESNRLLVELSRLDPLTGLSNRRHAHDSFLTDYSAPAADGEARVAALLLDIDHFKAFNDRWGHQMGDDCLVAVAELMRHTAQTHGGLAARFGGEEFLILLRVRNATQALEIAEMLRRDIERIEFALLEEAGGRACCSASIGVAVHAGDESPQLAPLIARADDALYRAKKAGRNRTALAE